MRYFLKQMRRVMIPVLLGVVTMTLAVTAGVVHCLPRVIPVKLTLTLGNQRR